MRRQCREAASNARAAPDCEPRGRAARPLLLGHRGARLQTPENTLAAFQLALTHGCNGFEFDVRRTADGRAIVCHDEHISRHRVATSSFLELLHLQPTLATLEEVLARFAQYAYLCIELKVSGLEDETLRALTNHPPACGYVVASFEPDILCAMRARASTVPLGLICSNSRELMQWRALPASVVMLHWCLADRVVIEELHAAGRQAFVWTVNRAAQMRSVAEAGADAILSDDTDRLVRTLRPG